MHVWVRPVEAIFIPEVAILLQTTVVTQSHPTILVVRYTRIVVRMMIVHITWPFVVGLTRMHPMIVVHVHWVTVSGVLGHQVIWRIGVVVLAVLVRMRTVSIGIKVVWVVRRMMVIRQGMHTYDWSIRGTLRVTLVLVLEGWYRRLLEPVRSLAVTFSGGHSNALG